MFSSMSRWLCHGIAEGGKVQKRQGFTPRAFGNAALDQPFLRFLTADAERGNQVVFHGFSAHGKRGGSNTKKQVFIPHVHRRALPARPRVREGSRWRYR